MPLVYRRLIRIARGMQRWQVGVPTLAPCDLVHETYLLLVCAGRIRLEGTEHFYSMAARIMRRILMQRARYAGRLKRGGGYEQVSSDALEWMSAARPAELRDLDDALSDLAAHAPQQAAIVKLRFFGGFDRDQIAAMLGISSATVTRRWQVARDWLHGYLRPLPSPPVGREEELLQVAARSLEGGETLPQPELSTTPR